ncbi:MAG: TonB-dependent receptor [Terriglobales bacterium]
MRFSRWFARTFFLVGIGLVSILTSIVSAEIKVKVVDPQDAVVAGAQVRLLKVGKAAPAAVLNTSSVGTAIFRETASGSEAYRVQVLAPGFAAEKVDVSATGEVVTVKLRVASAAETLVVTATRTPVASQAAGAEVDTLSSQQLEAMQPLAADDAMRFLPGAVVNTYGQRGGLSSLFVRGGESTYNKVIVDGVYISEPSETFDFGTLPLAQADRLEFVRGAQSTLYGSDAMTSVVQVWTRTGSTPVPELRFGADGGNFGTANGYASLTGTYRRFDYNFFGDQINTNGQGVNNAYSDSLQGANVGTALSDAASLRIRVRHSNSYVGLPGAWDFNGDALVPPLPVGDAHANTLLGSVELTVAAPSGWQHRLTASDYFYRYNDNSPEGNTYNFVSLYDEHVNHMAFEYQGDYSERTWAHSTFGYRIENENALVNYPTYFSETNGHRLDQDAYLQQQLTLGRLSVIAGGRFVHSSTYGNTGVPRVALTLLALRGGDFFSGTRLRFSYATAFMEPDFQETFANLGSGFVPNPGLLPVRTRAFEAGFQQSLLRGHWALNATYFNNLFHDQIEYGTNTVTYMGNPPGTLGEYFNVQQSFAQGAEVELQGRIRSRLSLTTAYTYTSTEILENPLCTPTNPCSSPFAPGDPLLRRPKHSATTLFSYLGTHWGANVGGSFVGRRPDSDFVDNLVDHAAGYARVDLGAWYAINSRVTAYANLGNALNAHYNEVVGYPAMTANFRAGFRFRIGGE